MDAAGICVEYFGSLEIVAKYFEIPYTYEALSAQNSELYMQPCLFFGVVSWS